MAEALAAVGVAANIVQLIDFSTRVVRHLDEFHSVAGEVPKSFRHIKDELPLLETTLQQLKGAIDAGSVVDGSQKALVPIIAGCHAQIAQLDTILVKILPETGDHWLKKGKKIIVSLHHDTEVESITRVLRNYIGTLTFYYAAASSTLQPFTDKKLCEIRQWLSAPDPSTNYQNALKLQQADTGLWFLEGEEYGRWKTNATSPLWLYGIPGCGKTVLSSTILQNVLQHCRNDPGRVAAYFFFDFNDVQKQSSELMLRSLLCQLSQQSIKIPASLDTLFSLCENGQQQPSMYALLEALRRIIQELPQVYIVLDALDECVQRIELVEMLETIAGWQIQNLHLLVTSRREQDIECSLEGFVDDQNRVCLQSTLVDKDIQRYVRQRLSTDKNLQKWEKDDAVRQEIEIALKDRAHGMFRWAACQLDTLGKCRNRTMLRKALATLPPTLDQTYDRILSAISEEDSEYAIRILRWLTFSARPLLVDEVAEIIAIDVKRDLAFDRDEVLEDPFEALNICSSLVTLTIDNKDPWRKPRDVIALAHYSVKEYLVSDRIWKGEAAKYGMRDAECHNAIATSCISYLLQFQSPELTPDNFLEIFKLAGYSAKFWISHAQKTGDRVKDTSQVAISLCSKENPAYLNWIRLYNPDDPWEDRPNFRKGLDETPDPLYYAALGGLEKLVELLLDAGADVNAQNKNNSSALHKASYGGHEQIVKLLLNAGADVNAQNNYNSSALHVASYKGHEQIVKLLLNAGADVNAQNNYNSSALHVASYKGHEQIVKLLLNAGVDVNAQNKYNSSALHEALYGGHEQIVKLLLNAGANVNT